MQCLNPVHLRTVSAGFARERTVPCGKCLACLSNRRSDWVIRLQEEAKSSLYSVFFTLTYDDDHIPVDGVSKRDIQLFMKRFRKELSPILVRYFISSEYGPQTLRPHYHGVLFLNGSVDILLFLQKSWQNGFVTIGDVNNNRLGYVAKYCLSLGQVPEGQNSLFMLCSRRPAIGDAYLTDSVSFYHRDGLNDFYRDGKSKRRLPRYYREKLFDDDMKYNLRKQNEDRASKSFEDYSNKYDSYDLALSPLALSMAKQMEEDFKRRALNNLSKNSQI